jgi:hypothetical protein
MDNVLMNRPIIMNHARRRVRGQTSPSGLSGVEGRCPCGFRRHDPRVATFEIFRVVPPAGLCILSPVPAGAKDAGSFADSGRDQCHRVAGESRYIDLDVDDSVRRDFRNHLAWQNVEILEVTQNLGERTRVTLGGDTQTENRQGLFAHERQCLRRQTKYLRITPDKTSCGLGQIH